MKTLATQSSSAAAQSDQISQARDDSPIAPVGAAEGVNAAREPDVDYEDRDDVAAPRGRLRILRLDLSICESNATYNQFTLPWLKHHHTTLCTYAEPDVTPPAEVPLFTGRGRLKGWLRFFRAPGYLRVLRDALRSRDYDIVHAHSIHVALLYLVARWLWRGSRSTPCVFTLHNSYENHHWRNRILLVPVMAAFHRIVCCGQASLDSLPTHIRRLAGRRLTSVPNGADVERIEAILREITPARHGGTCTFLSVGRLVEIKNPFLVTKAFAQIANEDSRLVFVGSGPLREDLDRQSGSRVLFRGQIPRAQVFTEMAAADVFVSSSAGEGLPVAVLEAMACGLPVILSDLSSHREIAQDADFIPLIPADDMEGFAREMSRLQSMSAEARRAVGQQCQELVRNRFSVKLMRERYEAVYADLLAESNGARRPPQVDVTKTPSNRQPLKRHNSETIA